MVIDVSCWCLTYGVTIIIYYTYTIIIYYYIIYYTYTIIIIYYTLPSSDLLLSYPSQCSVLYSSILPILSSSSDLFLLSPPDPFLFPFPSYLLLFLSHLPSTSFKVYVSAFGYPYLYSSDVPGYSDPAQTNGVDG